MLTPSRKNNLLFAFSKVCLKSWQILHLRSEIVLFCYSFQIANLARYFLFEGYEFSDEINWVVWRFGLEVIIRERLFFGLLLSSEYWVKDALTGWLLFSKSTFFSYLIRILNFSNKWWNRLSFRIQKWNTSKISQ